VFCLHFGFRQNQFEEKYFKNKPTQGQPQSSATTAEPDAVCHMFIFP
jgi:hypothetical protein